MRKLKVWFSELRAPFLTATLASIILGTVVAWVRSGLFNLQYFLLAMLAGVLLHLGTNVANDYYDHRSGNDEINKEFVRPFSGGSRTIQLGLLTPKEVISGAMLLFASATVIGLYLTWVRGPFVLALGLIGLISGLFYTAPPLNWVSRGIGEAMVGLNFGALMTVGSYYVQTQQITIEPLIASLPVSLLIAAVLYINEFPDYEADKAVGKRTTVVRLGRKNAAYGYVLIVSGAYVSVLTSLLAGIVPLFTIAALIPLPLAIEAVKHALRYHSEPFGLVPANATTILLHLLTSLLVSLGYLAYSFTAMSAGFIVTWSIVGACAFSTIFSYVKIWKSKKPAKHS